MADEQKPDVLRGGRFAGNPAELLESVNASIHFDKRLYRQDIEGSRAHAAMLAHSGIISENDAAAIEKGLVTILSEIDSGSFTFSSALEDIHMNIESRLKDLVGGSRGKAAYRKKPERSGCHRFSNVGARSNRQGGNRIARFDFKNCRSGGPRRGFHHARIYPSPVRATRDLGASHACVCRNVQPRLGTISGCAKADERIPAWCRRSGRNFISNRPGSYSW